VATKPYGIFSPTLGLKLDINSILLKEAYASDVKDCFFQKGEVWRVKKRREEFSYSFPDTILNLYYYEKPSTSEKWLVVFTKRDIAYRDVTNDRFVFINKIYKEGVITDATQNSGGSFSLTFLLPSGEDLSSNVKAGDFIRLSSASSPYTSDDTWYEILSVDSGDSLTCSGTLPSGYSVPSGGDVYAIRKTFSGGEDDYWSFTNFNEKLIATNRGRDNIIIWTGSGQVQDLTCPYKARYVYSYNQRVLLGYTIESGQEYPFRIRWSGIGDETDWGTSSGSDSGYMTLYEGDGVFQGFATLRGALILFKDEAIIRAWDVETADIFNKNLVLDSEGTVAPYSIITKNDRVYFWASDRSFKVFDGMVARRISDNIDDIVGNINVNKEGLIQSFYIEKYNHILFAIPYGTSDNLNKVLIYDLDYINNNWGSMDMEISCLGWYIQESTLSWADLPYSNWSDWDWPDWKYTEGSSGYPIDIAGGYTGKIYRLNADNNDLGSDYEAYIVLESDLEGKKGLPFYKRLTRMQVWVEAETTGTMNIYVKRDNEDTWQSLGSIDLTETGKQGIISKELPVDVLAKVFKFKFSSESFFRLLGIIFWSDIVGDR